MPDSLLSLDQHLPRFTGRETLENKVDQVARYEYELLGALRFVIYHLDTRNFNMTEINKWFGTVMEPYDKEIGDINRRLEDTEGNITEIKITAEGIETTVRNQQGDISQIKQTADKIQMTVQDQQKNISRIEQTAKAIQMTVQSQTGDIAQLKITAQSIQSVVKNQQNDISEIIQTADKIQTTVQNQQNDISRIQQTATEISTTVQSHTGEISRIQQTAEAIKTTVQDQQRNISQIEQTAAAIKTTVTSQSGDISQIRQTAVDIQATVQSHTGAISRIQQTADAIKTTVQDQQKNISQIEQTAADIKSTVASQSGDISSIRQTAAAIQSTVQSHTGEISQIQQKAGQIQSIVTNQNDAISNIQQTANSITAIVAKQEENIGSMIEQTVNSISLSVENDGSKSTIRLTRNGINMSSQVIQFDGLVAFSDLEDEQRRTFINGANIITGTVRASNLYGNSIYLYDDYGREAGSFTLEGASSYWGQKILIDSGAIELSANPGDLHLSGGENPYRGEINISNGEVSVRGDLIPNSSGTYNCGTYGFPWADIYSVDGTISSSDRAGKMEIDYDMSRYEGLFDRLRPCSFLRRNGTSGRRHHGFVAQDMEEALEAEGMSGMDFAGFVKWKSGEDECGYGVRYEEIIAMLVHEVQELKGRINSLS